MKKKYLCGTTGRNKFSFLYYIRKFKLFYSCVLESPHLLLLLLQLKKWNLIEQPCSCFLIVFNEIFFIKTFFVRILFIRLFFIRIIRRNFYIVSNIFRCLFFFFSFLLHKAWKLINQIVKHRQKQDSTFN